MSFRVAHLDHRMVSRNCCLFFMFFEVFVGTLQRVSRSHSCIDGGPHFLTTPLDPIRNRMKSLFPLGNVRFHFLAGFNSEMYLRTKRFNVQIWED